MSDTGRKRSRKTKLVPRDFSEFVDDDCFLQEPPSKVPFLNKLKKDGESSTSSGLEFSVKVEVEDIDSLPEDDPSSYMKYLFSLSQDSSEKIDEDAWDKKIQDLDKTFIMDTRKMIKVFHGLHKKYPKEKEAVLHTRNAWGKVFYEKPIEVPPRHPQDLELQNTLSEWKNWLMTRPKETPFSYKCYICYDAWWHLMDFKNHIRLHEDCGISFEVVEQECNIVAYKGLIPEPEDIPIDGKCYKCAKTFKQHHECKIFSDYRYYCTHCKKQFLTCRMLCLHEGDCDKNPIRSQAIVDDIVSDESKFTEYVCKICHATFLTKPEKYEHLNVCHRVRSDEPIFTYSKVCRLCTKVYHTFNYHVCPMRNILYECTHCHGKFQNKHMLDLHLALSDRPFKCDVCDKFVMRQCMGPEHYAKHSENFIMMYRCLPCAKLKLFYTDDAFRTHRTRTHKKVDNRRPSWERIIVPKIILEQCELKMNVRRRRSNTIKRIKTERPAVTATKTTDEPERRRRRTTNSSENQENVETNTSAADNDSAVSESQNEPEDSKDFLRTLEQITETLDLKPEVIIKEEKVSEDAEDSKADLVKLIEETQKEQVKPKLEIPLAVREQSNKFKQIIQEVQESKLSNVSRTTKKVPETVIKQEIKEEPEEIEEDLIIIDSSNESIKQESENSDLSLLSIEPEIILKAGYRKRKIYKCNKCDYKGYHKEYREHMANHCRTPAKNVSLPTNDNFTCTKCKNSFDTLKTYAQHFVEHNYRFLTCPQCVTMFDSITKLVTHINTHVKNQFVRMQVINPVESEEKTKFCQCKTCKEVIDLKNTFKHWETHLEIQVEPEKKQSAVVMSKVNSRGDNALEPDVLKRILDLLQHQDRIDKTLPKRVKTCLVCQRHFERQNDCKRHLVEHLLEDAYANVDRTELLKCQICGEIHKKPDLYKKHMRDHASLPIYQCGLCDKTFSDSSNFTKHKKVHNLKAYTCDVCSKKFQAKFSLEKHIQLHMSTDPFSCDRCDRVFYDRSFYRRHIRQHHERPQCRFKCMICKERFESLRLKWDHMWETHNVRKDKADCPICKKSYRKVTDVRKHTQMEHGFNISLANVFQLVDKFHKECDKMVEGMKSQGQNGDESSDDDVLLIEEERETLVIYDD